MSETTLPPIVDAPPRSAPSYQALERRSRRYRQLDFALLSIILAANAYLAFSIATQVSIYALFVSAVLFGLSVAIHLGWTLSLFSQTKVRLEAISPNQKIGRYQAGEIYLIMRELLAPFRGREIPNVYLTGGPHEGAYVLNSLLFNWIKPLNAVYLSTRLLRILRPGELRAILSHELAHFFGYIRPLNRARFALMGLNALVPISLSLDHGHISLWAAFLVWLVFSVFYMRIINAWLSRASQDHEHLCDLAAAKRYGVLSTVNGLLTVVRVSETQIRVVKLMLERIRKDSTLSLAQLEKLVAQCEAKLPDGPLRPREIVRALKETLASPETASLRKRLTKAEQMKEEKSIKEISERLLLDRTFQLISWKSFDRIIPDGRLGRAEYESLIQILRHNPDEQLFDVATDNVPYVAKGSHPTVAQRILFLEQARQEDPSIAL